MSFEMQPSPVTGFRRRNDALRRDTERADEGGELATEEEAVDAEDREDTGDMWLEFIVWWPWFDLFAETLNGGSRPVLVG